MNALLAMVGAAKACRGCGVMFNPRSARQDYHDGDCRNRTKQARHRKLERSRQRDVVPVSYRDAVWEARRRGLVDELDAIELLACPSERILGLLEERVA